MIIGKEFVPRPETQITVGVGGVHSQTLAGDYLFRVQVPQESGKIYTVSVDLSVYDAHGVGDRYYFNEPKSFSR